LRVNDYNELEVKSRASGETPELYSHHPQGFGPWSPGLHDPTERKAQLRALQAPALVYLGPHHPLISELRAGETDALAFARAQALVEALPSLHRRKLLGTFTRVTWPRGAR
jgi:hypothetical protein